MRHHNLLSRAPMMGPLSSGKIWAAHGAYGGGFDFYVDRNASDANDGTSEATAFATFSAAMAASATGNSIGASTSATHLLGTVTDLSARSVGKYGSATHATVESTQDLSGKTWTLVGTNAWKTTVTLAEASQPNGTASNTFIPKLWFGDTWLEWKVGGADIAANIASVDAAAGSFAINVTGSTTQDVRSDVAATGFDVIVHLPDGSDPNGQDVRISDRANVAKFGSYTYSGLILRGAHDKDQAGVPATDYTLRPTFANCKSIDAGEHCWVGPLNTTGTFVARGRPIPGMTGFAQGRGAAAALNHYTNVHNSTMDLTHDTLDLADQAIGLYGHGSGNQGYRSLTVQSLILDNITKGVQMDTVPTTLLPFITGTLTIEELTATDVDEALNVDGVWVINGGSIAFRTDPLNANRQTLAQFNGTAPSLTLKNMTVDFTLTVGAGKARYLAFRNTSAAHTAPLLTLDNFQDISAAGKAGFLYRGGTDNVFSKVRLVIQNGSVTGSLLDQATGINYPASLYVGPGCTSGLGDRDGPACDTVLAGAGLVEDEAQALAGVAGYFYLDPQSTIVNRAGTVLSSPGWK